MSVLPALQAFQSDGAYLRRPRGAAWEKIVRAAELPMYGFDDQSILERLGWRSMYTLQRARKIYRHHTWALWADMKTAAELVEEGYPKTYVLKHVRWDSRSALDRALYVYRHATEDLQAGLLGGLSIRSARVVVDAAILDARFPKDWMPYLIENALCYQLSASKLQTYIERIIAAEENPRISRRSLELEKLVFGRLLEGLS